MCGFCWLIALTLLQLPAGTSEETLDVNGTKRSYLLHLPKGYDANKPTPVVLAFHGWKETAATMEADSGLSDKADQAGFIVVYPNGLGQVQSWNAGTCCGSSGDDVDFCKKLLVDVAKKSNVDANRIYATGMSNGAMMTNRLACEMSDRIAAIASVAGTRVLDGCTPKRAVPVMHIHGTKDIVIPYDGRTGKLGIASMSVDRHIDFWIKHNHASSIPTDSKLDGPPLEVIQHVYAPTAQGSAEVVLIEIKGGGHLWLGRPIPARFNNPEIRALLGETNQKTSGNDLIWNFFTRHKLP